jgi:hypothetical protein
MCGERGARQKLRDWSEEPVVIDSPKRRPSSPTFAAS